jgi:adenylate cyclase
MSSPDPDLQAILLGGSESYTRDEMARASHLSMDQVGRLWRAMGFPDVGDARAFTDADLTALLRVASLVERGMMDMDAVVQVARSLGQTTSRLADWQVDALGRHATDSDSQQPLKATTSSETADDISELLPELEQLLVYVWRRQMAATIGRGEAENPADPQRTTTTATVGFADLVSFTRLSRQLDESDLGTLVETFESVSADVIHAQSGRLVKTLGDEVMFVADTPQRGARIALELHAVHARKKQMPELRVGLASGAVATRMGDVYGTTVNRASRNTALARPGSTILDSATSDALQDLAAAEPEEFNIKALTPRPMRGFGIVRPYALVGRGSD